MAYGLEGICAVAAARGDAWRTGALAKAAATVRQRTGLFEVQTLLMQTQHLAALREHDPGGLTAGERAGAELSLAEAVALALPDGDDTPVPEPARAPVMSRGCRLG